MNRLTEMNIYLVGRSPHCNNARQNHVHTPCVACISGECGVVLPEMLPPYLELSDLSSFFGYKAELYNQWIMNHEERTSSHPSTSLPIAGQVSAIDIDESTVAKLAEGRIRHIGTDHRASSVVLDLFQTFLVLSLEVILHRLTRYTRSNVSSPSTTSERW